MQKLLYTALILGFILALGQAGKMDLQAIQQENAAQVYSTCIKAHNEISGTSERACGDIQDKTGLVFTCSGDISPARGACTVQ